MNERAGRRHAFLYRLLRALVRLPVSLYMHYACPRVKLPDGPCIVLANHNTDLDPLLVAFAFDRHMYFVASEHVFRKGFWSKALTKIFAPISRMKGSTDAAAALEILRRLKRKENVCLFPEGNRSYTGVTGEIFPATGKLVKASGATLVTFRFLGGYLATPRWARNHRRGPVRGELRGIYAPDALRKMDADAVNALIAKDIFEDAFLRQERERTRYPARAKAEWLETALYVCPKCQKIGTLHSFGDTFACDICGLQTTYTDEGLFAGGDAPFHTVRDWDVWQTEWMRAYINALGDGEAFSDGGVTLERIGEGHEMSAADSGRLVMSRSALTVGKTRFPLAEISGMALFGKAKIALTAAGAHYEIRFPPAGCGRKYLLLYEMIHG